ncbi:MAG: hypothetical protein ACI9XU_001646 [Arenicella sp.]|jgi:hypothetical protein
MLNERQRALLVLNGIAVVGAGIFLAGWLYFFMLLEGIRLFPFIEFIQADVPGDRRAWNMAHLEGITNGLLLMATAMIAPYIKLNSRLTKILFWTSLIYAWMFTLPAIANALFETRGLAYGGGPFEGGLANDLIFLSGWPPFVSVHIAFALLAYGVWQHYKSLK